MVNYGRQIIIINERKVRQTINSGKNLYSLYLHLNEMSLTLNMAFPKIVFCQYLLSCMIWLCYYFFWFFIKDLTMKNVENILKAWNKACMHLIKPGYLLPFKISADFFFGKDIKSIDKLLICFCLHQ